MFGVYKRILSQIVAHNVSLDSDIGAIKFTAFDGAVLRVILEVVPFMSSFARKKKKETCVHPSGKGFSSCCLMKVGV